VNNFVREGTGMSDLLYVVRNKRLLSFSGVRAEMASVGLIKRKRMKMKELNGSANGNRTG